MDDKITKVIEGYLDSVSDGHVHGWARNTRSPSQAASVRVHCNGQPIGTAVAGLYRPDLEQAGVGDGKHAFSFPLPEGVEGELTVWANGTRLKGAFPAPHLLSEIGPHQRYQLAKNYLKGEGIEIGALDKPMRAPDGVRIRTVDRLPSTELSVHYGIPESAAVDFVCDAQKLQTIDSGSQDFVIANHVFEHMENPIAALENWVRVLRPGGFLFMAIPDKRFTFDVDRPPTPLAHVLEEYREPGRAEANREAHYVDWIRLVEHTAGDIHQRLRFLIDCEYSIHFHCWTGYGLIELFESVSWIGFELDCYKFNRPEGIFILRKV